MKRNALPAVMHTTHMRNTDILHAGICSLIHKFTRFSGELFALFIGTVFMQEAFKGTIDEFRVRNCSSSASSDCQEFTDKDRLINGLWALLLALATLCTCELFKTARSWPFFKARFCFLPTVDRTVVKMLLLPYRWCRQAVRWLSAPILPQPGVAAGLHAPSTSCLQGAVRSFLADYGVPLMVVVWSMMSFILESTMPDGLPRRLTLPNIWEDDALESVNALTRLSSVTGAQVGYAAVPGLLITVLFFFGAHPSELRFDVGCVI